MVATAACERRRGRPNVILDQAVPSTQCAFLVVNQLEPVDLRDLVYLLEPTWKRTNVLEALLLHILDDEPQHILVELLDRDAPVLLVQVIVTVWGVITA